MSLNQMAKKSIITGLIAGTFLFGLYFLILSLANSFSHALEQFSQMRYWILILSAGFGFQAGLYVFIKNSLKEKQVKNPTAVIAASGGVSTGAMITCCLHHLTDVLPVVGLGAAALFLIQYQTFFLFIGVLSNIIGITIMLEIAQKNQLSDGFLKNVLIFDMGKIKIAAILTALVASSFFLIMLAGKKVNAPVVIKEDITSATTHQSLASKTDERDGISFEVTPIDFSPAQPVKFEIKIDTHSGSLDFDMTKISVLEDDKSNKYYPLAWQGGSGGHHLSGILTFPALKNSQVKNIRLTVQDAYLRIFEWNLQ